MIMIYSWSLPKKMLICGIIFHYNLGDEEQLTKWMEMAFADKKAETRRPFTIIDKATGKIAGSSSMGNISYHDLRLEIGWSWLGTDFRSTGINRHAKYCDDEICI